MNNKHLYKKRMADIMVKIDLLIDSISGNKSIATIKSAITTRPWIKPKSWMGNISNKCTASLIAPKWALTAKHCQIQKDFDISFGYRVSNKTIDNPFKQWIHNYKFKTKIKKIYEFCEECDIYLLELEDALTEIEYVSLAGINSSLDIDKNNLTLYSIGAPYNYPVKLPLVGIDKFDCDLITATEANYFVRSDRGSIKGTICKGDSGSAVVGVYNEKNIQIGIMSHICETSIETPFFGFGINNCIESGSTVARIQIISNDMLNAIRQIIQENDCELPTYFK